MSMPMVATTSATTWQLPGAARADTALSAALGVAQHLISGRTIPAFADRVRVSAVAVSAHLLASVIIADPDSFISAGKHLSGYLRDWNIMGTFAHGAQLVQSHPVWAVYREFVSKAIGADVGSTEPQYNDIPGYTDETIVTGIGYAVSNLVMLRLGATEETFDEFLDTYSALS